jgi:starvation-inducible DNA-binding protein
MHATDDKPRREILVRQAPGITAEGANAISYALNVVLADLFALYVKTKNFHWHMTGAHFRDYHLLLDEQSAQVLATIDPAAERVRKLGRSTLRSLGQIARLRRAADNDAADVTPTDMLSELHGDNLRLSDIATASLIENWIDEADGRIWFLAETIE